MAYFLLLLCIASVSAQSPLKKLYQRKSDKGVLLFSALTALVAALFFGGGALFSGNMGFEIGALPYSVAFGACYAVCIITQMLALGCGSLALTSLFGSYSLIFPTVYGLLFRDASVYLTQVIGVVLLLGSLYLTNMRPGAKSEGEPKVAFSWKWLILATLMAVSNGGCTIIQQEQQLKFNGAYKNEFMFIALMIAVVACVAFAFVRERRDFAVVLRHGTFPAVLVGVCNGAANLLVMIIAGVMSPVFVFFPISSAGGLLISYLISVFIFKESFGKMQKLGIVIGMIALVFLNLEILQLF